MPQTTSTTCSSEAGGPVGQGDYIVCPGDCMASIAAAHGFFWETLWNNSDNAVLKRARKDPNVLLPRDRVTIPALRVKTEQGATEQRHRFRRKGVPEKLRITLLDEDGEPRANVSYILTIDGENRRGTTDGDGRLQEPIAPTARRGQLILLDEQGNPTEEHPLDLGLLDPIETVSGVQMRLSNLGFECGHPDGQMNHRTREALKSFQVKQELEATGDLNDTTRQKLHDVYGS